MTDDERRAWSQDERVAEAIEHLAMAEFDKALALVRDLDRDFKASPEERRRREMKRLDAKVQKELGPAAAAYARWQKKTGRVP